MIEAPPVPLGTLCLCGKVATDQWHPNVCALEGMEIEWVPVCSTCDVELNEFVVRKLFGSKYDTELANYRHERLGEEP